jgi:hypothetical protein
MPRLIERGARLQVSNHHSDLARGTWWNNEPERLLGRKGLDATGVVRDPWRGKYGPLDAAGESRPLSDLSTMARRLRFTNRLGCLAQAYLPRAQSFEMSFRTLRGL